MQQTLLFNLFQPLDGLWCPEGWLCLLDEKGQPYALKQRINQAQLTDLGIELSAEITALLQAATALSTEALTAHFCKKEGKKTPTLAELWADKTARPSMEKYIYRRLDQFYQGASVHCPFISINAAKKAVLPQHIAVFSKKDAAATLHLKRTETGLEYRLEVVDGPDGARLDLTKVTVLTHTAPAWFLYEGLIYHLPDVNGKMLLPFRQKTAIEVGKSHEKTWFRQFLKKNIDRAAKVEAEGFNWEDHNELQHCRLSIIKHLFENRYQLSLHFEYTGHAFYFGERELIRSTIEIPDDETQEVQITRIVRDVALETERLEFLLAQGLTLSNRSLECPNGDALSEVAAWLTEHKQVLLENGIIFELIHPEQQQALTTETPEIKTEFSSDKDWFDLHIYIVFPDFKIPFKAFVSHIRQRRPEFPLPNGAIFLIPEAWFTRYAELADIAFAQEAEAPDLDSIRVSVLHKTALDNLGLDQKATLSSVRSPTGIPVPWRGGAALKATLRPYQLTGVEWVLSLLSQGFGACLADDMGLGKTLQTIAVLAHFKTDLEAHAAPVEGLTRQLDLFSQPAEAIKPLRALLIVPASLVFNWQSELNRFAPQLFVYTHTGPKRLRDKRAISAHDICLTTYHTAREDEKMLAEIPWQFLIIDESQNIKNRSSEIAQMAFKMPARHKMALSGTPVENSLSDLWSLLHFIQPNLLGSFPAFSRLYLTPIEKEKNAAAKERLSGLIRPFIMRRRKEEVAPELPALSRQWLLTDLHEDQITLYEKTKSAARNVLLQIGAQPEDRFTALQALMKLRQIACHPALLDPESTLPSGKMDFVLEQWNSIAQQGSKVLIFSTFEQHLALYRAHFDREKIPYAWISGSTPAPKRQEAVERFQTNASVQTFFITLKSGGTGLNLTAADYVFILDPWWNPQAEEQAIARAHRIGQDKPVHAIRFLSKGTIEEKIALLQAEKLQLSEQLIDDDMPHWTLDDMRALIAD